MLALIISGTKEAETTSVECPVNDFGVTDRKIEKGAFIFKHGSRTFAFYESDEIKALFLDNDYPYFDWKLVDIENGVETIRDLGIILKDEVQNIKLKNAQFKVKAEANTKKLEMAITRDVVFENMYLKDIVEALFERAGFNHNVDIKEILHETDAINPADFLITYVGLEKYIVAIKIDVNGVYYLQEYNFTTASKIYKTSLNGFDISYVEDLTLGDIMVGLNAGSALSHEYYEQPLADSVADDKGGFQLEGLPNKYYVRSSGHSEVFGENDIDRLRIVRDDDVVLVSNFLPGLTLSHYEVKNYRYIIAQGVNKYFMLCVYRKRHHDSPYSKYIMVGAHKECSNTFDDGSDVEIYDDFDTFSKCDIVLLNEEIVSADQNIKTYLIHLRRDYLDSGSPVNQQERYLVIEVDAEIVATVESHTITENYNSELDIYVCINTLININGTWLGVIYSYGDEQYQLVRFTGDVLTLDFDYDLENIDVVFDVQSKFDFIQPEKATYTTVYNDVKKEYLFSFVIEGENDSSPHTEYVNFVLSSKIYTFIERFECSRTALESLVDLAKLFNCVIAYGNNTALFKSRSHYFNSSSVATITKYHDYEESFIKKRFDFIKLTTPSSEILFPIFTDEEIEDNKYQGIELSVKTDFTNSYLNYLAENLFEFFQEYPLEVSLKTNLIAHPDLQNINLLDVVTINSTNHVVFEMKLNDGTKEVSLKLLKENQ